jgi:hypothetical protein
MIFEMALVAWLFRNGPTLNSRIHGDLIDQICDTNPNGSQGITLHSSDVQAELGEHLNAEVWGNRYD